MSIPNPNSVSYSVLLDGEKVWNALLGLSVSNEINRVPRARLEFNYREIEKDGADQDELFKIEQADDFDPRPKNAKVDFIPGKEIEIKLGRDGETETVFKGYIIKQNVVARNDGSLNIYIDCRHVCNRMTLHNRTRFYHHDANKSGSANQDIDTVTDLDVLEKIVDNYNTDGLSLVVEDERRTETEHENMTQYECSDWDFLIIRAEALGYVCLVDGDIINLINPKVAESSVATLEFGEEIMEYEAIYDETIPSEQNHATAWDVDKLERSYTNLKNGNTEALQETIQTETNLNYGAIASSSELDVLLVNEVMRQKTGLIQGTTKIEGTTAFVVGDTIEITGFQSVWDRDTLVSGIKHVLVNGVWHSHVQFGLSTVPHAEKYQINRTIANPLLPRTSGLLMGKVIQYKNGADGHELIEVEIPAYNAEETTQSIYARLANFAAGANGGAVFRPYPDDEVIVGFVNDDPRHPVILGALYNSTTEPPYALDEDTQNEVGFSFNDWKISIHEEDEVMTIASPKGQEFVLDDSDESILMAFDSSNQIKISSDGIELTGSNIILDASSGGKIEMAALEIEAKADTSMALEGGTQLELEGKVTASLKGQITQIN
jgi:uncharacterized protein involved in type VI secretion and phage assembly